MNNSAMRAGWVLAICMVLAGLAVAQDETKPKRQFSDKQLAQQQRMKDCAADAKQRRLRGDDRQALMKTCLSGGQVDVQVGDEAASAPDQKSEKRLAQEHKMKACEAEATTQRSENEVRQQFIRECLSQ